MNTINEFQPLGVRVLVKFRMKEDKFKNIIMPKEQKQQLMTADIISLGNLARDDYGLEKGDVVFTPYWVGIDMEFYNFNFPEGVYKLITAGEVLAKVVATGDESVTKVE